MSDAIIPMLPSDRVEQMRREIAALLFFAMPRKDATADERADAYQRRVRGLLGLLDILNGTAEPEHSHCEGCDKILLPEMPRHVCEDGEDLCADCTPEGYEATSYGYRAEDADADIARARELQAEMHS